MHQSNGHQPRELGDVGDTEWDNPEIAECGTDEVAAPRSCPEGGGSPAAPVWWGHVHNCTLNATQPFPGSCPALSSTTRMISTDNHPINVQNWGEIGARRGKVQFLGDPRPTCSSISTSDRAGHGQELWEVPKGFLPPFHSVQTQPPGEKAWQRHQILPASFPLLCSFRD